MNKDDTFESIKFLTQGCCPCCRQPTLVVYNSETTAILLSKHGLPEESYSLSGIEKIICTNCNYKGIVGKDFIKLEDGSYKFVTEGEYIYEVDRMSNLPPIKHLHVEGNPFVNVKENK